MRLNEFDAEVEESRDRICKFIQGKKDVLMITCSTELNIPVVKMKHYMEWLALRGFLIRRKVTTLGRRQYAYNEGTPYIKREQPTEQVEEEVPPHVRVIRLVDRPYVNPDPNKRSTRRGTVAIGSSMNMFGGGW
jgi:hypothetical protein